MANVVGHELDFYPKVSVSTGKPHEVLLWETFANGTRRVVATGFGADANDAFHDLVFTLTENGYSRRVIEAMRETYTRSREPLAG